MSELLQGGMTGLIGIILFMVGAVTVGTIWWVGVCFVFAGLACMGWAVMIVAKSNEEMPFSRGF